MLKGKWKNQLGSILEVDEEREDGSFSGSYGTAVSRGDSLPPPHNVRGSFQICSDGGALVSFMVCWKIVKEGKEIRSNCTWNGKLFSGKDSFDCTWLLVTDLPDQEQWRSVFTNKDSFSRFE